MSFQKPFFLGIGGSGMSSLAFLLLSKGLKVGGYDGKHSAIVEKLVLNGATVLHKSDVLETENYDLAVYSSAIRLDSHPLVKKFKDSGIPLVHRSELLHQVMSEKKQISVAGSHGKTTTSAMTAFLLEKCGMSPSIMVGGEVAFLGGKGGSWGEGEWGIFESDESDGTFNNHNAEIRILTNVDEDHLDHYQTRENLLNAFARYMERTSRKLILNLDDVGIRDSLALIQDHSKILCFSKVFVSDEIAKDFSQNSDIEGISTGDSNIAENREFPSNLDNETLRTREKDTSEYPKEKVPRIKTFGIQNNTKNEVLSGIDSSKIIYYTIESGSLSFRFQEKEYSFSLKYPGEHYLKNALAAILACSETGVPIVELVSQISEYSGVSRRLEYLGSKNGIEVYDDYGHHPTEIKAVIQSMEGLKKNGRAIILFQPHRYTRTQNLYKEFAESLDTGESVYLLPIYPAGEDPIEGVGTELILDSMKVPAKILPKEISDGIFALKKSLKPGDKLITLGAGNVRDWGLAFLKD
ncbi:UDP-N-acetylmuramate--alanine ligase [Leptospira mayottensis]|uniref:Mur ligase family, glutamate ligase domain protein n=2 Tax=Leptospira mayottensis TaxID=1137606 RepID=A0AA87MM51_9LEPT|nr:UDP-N-acetylmuramate--alanine ligase [Leptospira mayottensis]AXR65995.1 UDP-N-acetylmuramate--alanine ligase [Leptospira mayottensis]AZQ03641.1 UDP-N-acetylmuramate--alanine ligase [Leptospira mayottensis 200901116]EKR98226.1 Mur ligase family, glutamate ligase domain protein [Leptospira mayottensis 200901122]TGM96213.1 UDP-N-acetylmuramate--alanine ligase [Leptospira mayottensis]